MNTEWIKALTSLEADGTPAVMITVVDERGSTPRNAGAKMVISQDRQFDTIGGGHLEYKAIKIARQMLEEGESQPRLERFSLGASLGQCCGGATTLLFEPLGTSTIQIALFGAGHVARAIIPILASLPCKVRWIDSREAEFPEHIPDGVTKVVNEYPVDEVDELPANSYFIVMTHNHQLDQELTEAILKRNDFTYYGLIGSNTKRKKFEHRLKAKGFNDEQIERMTCPMGIPEVKGKLPAEIAVSVAGEVIAHYNANFGQATQAPPEETTIVERLAV
ncbi:xanthine dehydrogenase accessory protein XdhC [Pontibacterium granulatum]|uniref:xanthine dehydrogenase accessory protein XdhC n=1 Tax=Pontibacterium granulatum TaxID=2036029 RepID=UPI00249BA263|nr:xanthine dehydrogenase accessory protein XdhC [Pontibacterium granulatum]MDI3324870.1 xanthine dehydrogenase accessory protein XdhC [Pontibacterium granulatum]